MRRSIPGTQDVRDREFMYIESPANETFHQLADSVSAVRPEIAKPSSGGAGEEKIRIKLKDGTSLMGISYKGDIEGWRRRFVGFCVVSARNYGSIREGRLFLSDSSSPLLEELEINFEK
jgi:hypothetical protein